LNPAGRIRCFARIAKIEGRRFTFGRALRDCAHSYRQMRIRVLESEASIS
jgi:hypothetical protein